MVDCLTLWLKHRSELATGRLNRCWSGERWSQRWKPARPTVWVVSNEVGWGIVPDNALARRFRDEAGFLHQALARVADEAVLVVAGLPLMLKTSGA